MLTRVKYIPTRYHHFPAMNAPNVFGSVRVNGTAQGISAGKIDISFLTGDSGWYSLSNISYLPADITATAAAFTSSWTNYDATNYTAGSYYKDSKNILHLEGLIKSGLIGGSAFSLPVGSYNTDYKYVFTVLTASGLGRVDLLKSDSVVVVAGSATWTSLDGIEIPIDAAWTNATYQNSWASYDPSSSPAGYFLDADSIMHLRGMVTAGTMAAAIFTLPYGRPTKNFLFPVLCTGNAIGRCGIAPSGVVSADAGSNGWFSMDGIHYSARAASKLVVPPYVNYWSDYHATWEPARYYRDSAGIVRAHGLIGGSWLPVGTSTLTSGRTCAIIRDDPTYTQVEPLG